MLSHFIVRELIHSLLFLIDHKGFRTPGFRQSSFSYILPWSSAWCNFSSVHSVAFSPSRPLYIWPFAAAIGFRPFRARVQATSIVFGSSVIFQFIGMPTISINFWFTTNYLLLKLVQLASLRWLRYFTGCLCRDERFRSRSRASVAHESTSRPNCQMLCEVNKSLIQKLEMLQRLKARNQ